MVGAERYLGGSCGEPNQNDVKAEEIFSGLSRRGFGLLFVVRGEAYLRCNAVHDVEEAQPAYDREAP